MSLKVSLLFFQSPPNLRYPSPSSYNYSYIKAVNIYEIEKKIKLGLEFYDLKQYEQSRLSFKEVLQGDPLNPFAFYCLGVLSSEQGEMEKAIDYFEKAVQMRPDYIDALNNLGWVLLGDLSNGFQEHEWRVGMSKASATVSSSSVMPNCYS